VSLVGDHERRMTLEEQHSVAADRLKGIVERAAMGKTPAKRKSIMDVFLATVPDPEVSSAPKEA